MSIKKHLIDNIENYYDWIINDKYGEIHFKILPYLSNIENGFFIEAGAYDGLHQSNTKILEDCGWKGLLIEPSYNKSIECYNNRSKETLVANCALVSSEYKDEFVYGLFDSPVSKVQTKYQDIGDGVIDDDYNILQKVKARTLTSILDEININYVDFISLDMEGYELEALKGIDFSRITFNYMLVEHNSDSYSLEELDSFLLDKGYKNIRNISNFDHKSPEWPGNHQDYLYKNINLE
jgi:FkbM family methyltransferase